MWRFGLVGWCAVVLGVSACDASLEVIDDPLDDGAFVEDEAGIRRTLLAEEVTLVATKAWSDRPTRKLFRNATEFDAFFGRGSARATGLDFRRQWVVFFSAGRQNTGGFSARIDRIEVSSTGKTYYPFATFRSPGGGCMVTQALTKPHHLVSISKSRTVPSSLRWTIDRPFRHCSCDAIACDDGTVCLESEGEALCVPRTDCTMARCTADTYCDDSSGTAQCLPRATCATILCNPGFLCTEASGTAECVSISPCAAVRCREGTYCTDETGSAACVSYMSCANVRCAAGTRCVEEPVDDCPRGEQCPPTRPACR